MEYRSAIMYRSIKISIIIVIVGAIVFFGFRQVGNWHKKKIGTAIERERKIWQIKANVLKEKFTNLQEELRHSKEVVSEQKLFEVFGEDGISIFPGQKVNCERIGRQIEAFFRYLDNKDYQ